MICPKCGLDELKVNESRDLDGGAVLRRRRECLACANRFTTYERPDAPRVLVRKRDGGTESYCREKVLSGVKKALVSRPFSSQQVEEMVDEIERKIIENHSHEIGSSQIGKIIIRKLKETDKVAYLRFVSVYKRFEAPEQFAKELETLK